MKNKFFYIGLNLVAPGMGQLSAKRYIRGIIQLLGAIGAIFWLAGEVMLPFLEFYSGDMLDNKLPEIKFTSMLMPILLFLAILVWSIIDLAFGLDKKNLEKIEQQ